jgi:tetratricopeptide (TPR) repeat protein
MSPISRQSVFLFLIAVGAAGLNGCAQPPQRPDAKAVSVAAGREKLALGLQDRGELAEALVQWKILSVIDPGNARYANQVETTRNLIEKKTKALILEGVANSRQGAREAARLSFLKALALDPKNKEAFDYLRQPAMQLPAAGESSAPKAGDGACCQPRGKVAGSRERATP